MLKSERKFGFPNAVQALFPDASDPLDSATVKDAVQCPDLDTCFKWAAEYHNITTVIDNLNVETYRGSGNWTDENNRPLLCELEDGVVRTIDLSILVRKRSPFFEFLNDIIRRIVEGEIFVHIVERGIAEEKLVSKFFSPTFVDNYYAISVRHLQTAFYLLMLGYVLAVVCFVTEAMWHRYGLKGPVQRNNSP
jgi:hypothetical protein